MSVIGRVDKDFSILSTIHHYLRMKAGQVDKDFNILSTIHHYLRMKAGQVVSDGGRVWMH